MRNLYYFILVLSLVNVSCSNSSPTKKSINNDSTKKQIHQESKEAIVKKVKIDNQVPIEINKFLLQGIWTESESQDANFKIKGDSMYFIEGEPCHIRISNDTLITFYGADFYTHDKILKLDNDSLILLNEVGRHIKLKRIK